MPSDLISTTEPSVGIPNVAEVPDKARDRQVLDGLSQQRLVGPRTGRDTQSRVGDLTLCGTRPLNG